MAEAGTSLDSTELETKTYSVGTLIDAIRKGRVRIPRFQRGFRWNDEDRRLLFDSLQAGYPVGTLLLARGEAPADRISLGGYVAEVPAVPDALWVVDGQQRLSTLAMALLEDHAGAYRPMFFDLQTARFVVGARRRAPPAHWIPAHVLASSSTLNKWLRESALPDMLSDRADEIARRIREYTIPAYLVPYDGHDDRLLRQIFARINRRGRALDSHEVFQALHASVQGQKGPIDRVREDLARLGFGVLDPAQVERTAIAVLGGDPGRSLADQADSAPGGVPALFERVSRSLALTIEFLAGEAGVPHIDLLPYSGTLYALARFFSLHERPHDRNRELLSRWFWRGTLSGDHKPDNRTDRPRWQAIDSDEHGSVQRLLRLLPAVGMDDLPTELRAFRRGTAQVKVELLAMCALGPRVLVGEDVGAEISVASLLTDGASFPCQLTSVPPGTEKTSAAFVLHADVSADDLRKAPPAAELLATHLIDTPAFQTLLDGNHAAFVARRSTDLLFHLRSFLNDRAALAPTDRDRPPVDAYFTEESA